MYKECQADISMKRVILGDCIFDNSIYSCKVIRYIPEKECIYLLAEEDAISDFSLDAIYECAIKDEKDVLKCQGYIKERYMSKIGKVVVFVIQNGFYKNPVN